MTSRIERLVIRASLALRQNRAAILFVGGWLVGGALAHARLLHLPPADALLAAACIARAPGGLSAAYQAFTEVVVFGLVASLVVTNVTRKYRPEETCRAIAGRARGHVVVIGATNLGTRVWDLARAERKPVVLVEENASAELVVRCPDEDVGAVLARTYRARALSTSRLAATFIGAQARKLGARSAVVLGRNAVGARAAAALAEERIAVTHVDATSDPAALAAAGVATTELVVLCDDDLGDNLIRVDRIRDLNARARIVCRAFHEDAAEILTRPPFGCVVLSTSRHAVESLVRAGVFRGVGIEATVKERSRRPLVSAEAR